uniref:Chromosomal replication initiator DnaA C-terminal domain-containing protein n=1 Tax=Dulem virus 40 TaxID=3145758 RepID=A0AAU8AW84_9CAUD
MQKNIAMSNTKDLVDRVLSVVADVTEIPCETILSKCSRTEVVDARWLAVAMLRRSGMYAMRIAEHLGITPRYVQYIITDFDDRIACNPTLRNSCERIAKKLRNDGEQTTK